MWKMFPIGFKSGLRGGIFKTSEWQRAILSIIIFFVSFTSQYAFTVTLLLPSSCRSSFTPLSQAPLFETFGFFSPYSPFGSSRLIHGVRLVNEGDFIQIKRNSFGPNSRRVIFLHLLSKFDSFHFVRFTQQPFFLRACRKKYPFLFNNRRTVRSVTWRIPALSIRRREVNEPSRSLNSAMLP